MATLGYIRVSDKTQNPDRQIEKMKALGISDRYLFVDKQSGKDFNRKAYQNMKSFLREGDTLYIDALDRLGRTYDGVIEEWKDITRTLGVDIVVLEDESLFDSRKFHGLGDLGKLLEDQFLSLLSYVAQEERKKINQRQKEGIELAKKNGVQFGRPKIEMTEGFLIAHERWRAGSITATQAMKICKMKRGTFYRRVKELETEKKENDDGEQ